MKKRLDGGSSHRASCTHPLTEDRIMIRRSSAPDKVPRSIRDKRAIYIAAVQRAIILACIADGRTTTDVVYNKIKRPAEVHPSCIGTAVLCLVIDKMIVVDSIATTTRKASRGRLLRVWRLADPAIGREWLSLHKAPAEGPS